MTYCVAALVEDGIVFASDSRTSAGADNVATFCKMMCWEIVGERVIVVLSSGNLATTQSVISLMKMRSKDESGKPMPNGVLGVSKMYDVAELLGSTLREVVHREREVRETESTSIAASSSAARSADTRRGFFVSIRKAISSKRARTRISFRSAKPNTANRSSTASCVSKRR